MIIYNLLDIKVPACMNQNYLIFVGFTGDLCAQDIDECEKNGTCYNGASCINTNGSYQCLCNGGYTGRYLSLCRGGLYR